MVVTDLEPMRCRSPSDPRHCRREARTGVHVRQFFLTKADQSMYAMKHAHNDTGNNVFNKFQVDTKERKNILHPTPGKQSSTATNQELITQFLPPNPDGVLHRSPNLSDFLFLSLYTPRALHSPPLSDESITAFDIAELARRAEDSSDDTQWTFCASAYALTSFMPFSWSIVSSSSDGRMSITSR